MIKAFILGIGVGVLLAATIGCGDAFMEGLADTTTGEYHDRTKCGPGYHPNGCDDDDEHAR